jgi:hypothetical protein
MWPHTMLGPVHAMGTAGPPQQLHLFPSGKNPHVVYTLMPETTAVL